MTCKFRVKWTYQTNIWSHDGALHEGSIPVWSYFAILQWQTKKKSLMGVVFREVGIFDFFCCPGGSCVALLKLMKIRHFTRVNCQGDWCCWCIENFQSDENPHYHVDKNTAPGVEELDRNLDQRWDRNIESVVWWGWQRGEWRVEGHLPQCARDDGKPHKFLQISSKRPSESEHNHHGVVQGISVAMQNEPWNFWLTQNISWPPTQFQQKTCFDNGFAHRKGTKKFQDLFKHKS